MRKIGLLAIVACGCAAPARPLARGPAPALQAALDADLRADWGALVAARRAVEVLAAEPAVKDYHLGWIDFRLSSLAYMVTGTPGQSALLARAVGELERSVAVRPAWAEAQALLAVCAAMLGNLDRARLPTLGPVVEHAWTAAMAGTAADSPRVQLLRAMAEFWMPPEHGGSRARGVERWRKAIELFEREPPPAAPAAAEPQPTWGHAEAWAWLGGAYLMAGRHAEATEALHRALALRPDFWWARVALAQAETPQP